MKKLLLCLILGGGVSSMAYAGQGYYLHFDNQSEQTVTVQDVGNCYMNQTISNFTLAAHSAGSSSAVTKYIEASGSISRGSATDSIRVTLTDGTTDTIKLVDANGWYVHDALDVLDGYFHKHLAMDSAEYNGHNGYYGVGVLSNLDNWMGLAYWLSSDQVNLYITIWGKNYTLPPDSNESAHSYIAHCDIKTFENNQLTANCLHDPQNIAAGLITTNLDYNKCSPGSMVGVRFWGDESGNGAGTLYCYGNSASAKVTSSKKATLTATIPITQTGIIPW